MKKLLFVLIGVQSIWAWTQDKTETHVFYTDNGVVIEPEYRITHVSGMTMSVSNFFSSDFALTIVGGAIRDGEDQQRPWIGKLNLNEINNMIAGGVTVEDVSAIAGLKKVHPSLNGYETVWERAATPDPIANRFWTSDAYYGQRFGELNLADNSIFASKNHITSLISPTSDDEKWRYKTHLLKGEKGLGFTQGYGSNYIYFTEEIVEGHKTFNIYEMNSYGKMGEANKLRSMSLPNMDGHYLYPIPDGNLRNNEAYVLHLLINDDGAKLFYEIFNTESFSFTKSITLASSYDKEHNFSQSEYFKNDFLDHPNMEYLTFPNFGNGSVSYAMMTNSYKDSDSTSGTSSFIQFNNTQIMRYGPKCNFNDIAKGYPIQNVYQNREFISSSAYRGVKETKSGVLIHTFLVGLIKTEDVSFDRTLNIYVPLEEVAAAAGTEEELTLLNYSFIVRENQCYLMAVFNGKKEGKEKSFLLVFPFEIEKGE